MPDRVLAYLYLDGSNTVSEADALGALNTACAKKNWEPAGLVPDRDGTGFDAALERMGHGEADVLAVITGLPPAWRRGPAVYERAEREGWRFALFARGIEQGVPPWDEMRAHEDAARAVEPLAEVPLPPANLRRRVSGLTDEELFEGAPVLFLREAAGALRRHGFELAEARSILDFGCGAGRLLRRLTGAAPAARITGVDVDPEAVEWVSAALPAVRAMTVPDLPPTQLAADEFDLVFGYSVFTHLDEGRQDAWLGELARVAAPRAAVVLTVHGEASTRWHREHPLFEVSAEMNAQLESTGIAFSRDDGWEREFPDWYHTTLHTADYVRSHWARWFDVLDVIPRGAGAVQDLVVLRAH